MRKVSNIRDDTQLDMGDEIDDDEEGIGLS